MQLIEFNQIYHFMNVKKSLLLLVFVGTYGYSQTKTYDIVNLDMNNSNSHYGLFFYQNNKVFFSAPILDYRNIKRKKRKKHIIYSLFEGKRNPNGQIIDVKRFEGNSLNQFNTSSAVVSPDGIHIYITTNYNGKGNTYKAKGKSYNLYIARGEYVKGKGWTSFKKLPFCNPNYSYGHPAISPDGDELYFVSNIPSAKGSTDIFKVYIAGDNEYSKPENLGELVNSTRKEVFPFIGKDGVLYFSSDRAGGFGALDVYAAEQDVNHHFKKAKNLPKPLNSKYDDFCYVVDIDNNEGYFSSKRPSGKGEDDIYYFTVSIVDDKSNTSVVSDKP